jgi:hypothetical protein
MISRFIIAVLHIPIEQGIYLSLDRRVWKLGSKSVNLLVLGIGGNFDKEALNIYRLRWGIALTFKAVTKNRF